MIAILGLYSVVKFTPLPGIPCEISAVSECAPSDATAARVPSTALLYAHLTLDEDTAQFDRATGVAGRLQRSGEVGQELLNAIAIPSGTQLSYAADIAPWAGEDAAIAVLPGPANTTTSAVMITIDQRQGAEELATKVAPPEGATTGEQEGVTVSSYPDGFATAIDGDTLLLGNDAAVTQLIAAARSEAKTVETDPAAEEIRDELPDNRFADVYLPAAGVQRLLARSTSTAATQLDTFVDYGATSGFGAAAVAREEGIELELASLLDPKKTEASPSFFANLPSFRPTLADDVGARALGYIGIGEAGESLSGLLQRAGAVQPGLGKALTDFATRLDAEAKVDPARDLLPALGGEAAIVAEPTDGRPFASLIVEGVDEARARDALARLQAPLVRSIQRQPDRTGGAPVAGFKPTEIDGVEAQTLPVSPAINLTYAIFDAKLVVSTDPAGIAQVRAEGEERLLGSDQYDEAVEPLPDSLSALVFLNLDELLDLAEALGRVEDPTYASLRSDIRKLHAIALGVSADDDLLRSRLFVTVE